MKYEEKCEEKKLKTLLNKNYRHTEKKKEKKTTMIK